MRMLLDGEVTSSSSPFPGFGPETSAQIEGRIESDNAVDVDDIWPLAPISIIVTPDGQWLAHPSSRHLDQPSSGPSVDAGDEADEGWTRMKQATFRQHKESTAVAWDLSWNFIGLPAELGQPRQTRAPRVWTSRDRSGSTSPASWRTRIDAARAAIEAGSSTPAP